MLDSVVHFQRCQVFHAHVMQLRLFEQRDSHFSQLESQKQDSSDVSIKSNRGSINREIGWPRDWSTTPNPSHPKSGIQVIAYINAEVGWRPIMLKPHSVTNGDRNILQQFL
ncbi:hypothetical protein AVEN_56164-1 [Araneus ventricosus]|uniref:Uncharacterized protein n=1 Tax=Araneus ventricosus TaxID=182803 RepID=A0A4Y2P6A3_ARAVE|nr:hypothetical protein AVEN_56164-1 [Araneus ventricosus]